MKENLNKKLEEHVANREVMVKEQDKAKEEYQKKINDITGEIESILVQIIKEDNLLGGIDWKLIFTGYGYYCGFALIANKEEQSEKSLEKFLKLVTMLKERRNSLYSNINFGDNIVLQYEDYRYETGSILELCFETGKKDLLNFIRDWNLEVKIDLSKEALEVIKDFYELTADIEEYFGIEIA